MHFPCCISLGRTIGEIHIYPCSGSRIEENTLETWGWIMQETQLPPLTVYTAKSNFFRHCRSRFLREGSREICNSANTLRSLKGFFVTETLDTGSRDDARSCDDWLEVIDDYFTRDLILKSGKFSALSVSLERCNVLFNDTYLTGIRFLWHFDGE